MVSLLQLIVWEPSLIWVRAIIITVLAFPELDVCLYLWTQEKTGVESL